MNLHRTIGGLRSALAPHRPSARIGLVPTMGALHAGHVALLDAARSASDRVVASIFVNPTQFGNQDDLASYPRTEAQDCELAAAAGVDELFIPSREEMYPAGFATWVDVEQTAGLEDAFRPGHFRGVATVCVKLFTIVQPTIAFFGQKDAQQVAVVRQLVRDLDLPLTIRVIPTVRDSDGLALSSRNVRLSPAERQHALAIPRALDAGCSAHRDGRDPVAEARRTLEGTPGVEIEYVATASFDGQPTLAIAVRVGATRLIDNAPLTAAPDATRVREQPSPLGHRDN